MTHRSHPEIVTVADVAVHAVDVRGALAQIDGFIRAGAPHYNIAINAAKIVSYQEDPALRDAIDGAHLVTIDGQAVVWAARALGQVVPERVAGADLMEELLAHSARRGYSVYLFGAGQDVVEECVTRAKQQHPALTIAGYRNGYFKAEDEAAIVAAIRDARPDILFLGFGSPKKEYFMKTHYRELGVPFVMGVGGTFDVFAGRVSRAPRWMQRSGLEWSYRLAQEPRRMWKRYLVGNTRFLSLVARELWKRRVHRGQP
ncbi:MAG TPA: WecB/TagA/CpsF family glycosyltransferase [Kofleriaceae bacterium]|nr:WecB/TagA/CpsF family glycosyltransferase [Kofleriaceae bacterium]